MTRMPIRTVSGALAFLASAVFVVGATTPVAAATASAAQTAETRPAAKPDDAGKKYCVKVQPTGRLTTSKVCRTRAEWIKATGFDPAKQ